MDKPKLLKVALAMQEIGVSEKMADQIITTYEALEHLGEKFTLKDAIDIEINIERKYKEHEKKESK